MNDTHCYRYDFSRWPLVVSCQYGNPVREDIEAFYTTFERYLARGEAYFSIAIIDHSDHTSTLGKEIATEWMKKNRDTIGKYSLGAALVISSPLLRGLVKAFMMFTRVPGGTPQIVTTMADALTLAEQTFARHSVTLPPASIGWPQIKP